MFPVRESGELRVPPERERRNSELAGSAISAGLVGCGRAASGFSNFPMAKPLLVFLAAI